MTKLWIYLVAGLLLELAGIAGFTSVSDSQWAGIGKILVIAIFILAMTAVFGLVANGINLRGMLGFSVSLAFLSVLLFQIIGFFVLPGIVKDLIFLSPEHIGLLGMQVAIAVFLYSLGGVLVWWIVRLTAS